MRFSFNCFNHSTYYGGPPDLPAQITAAATAGYDHVGLDVPSLLAHERAGLPAQAVADLLRERGISCYELVPLELTADADAAADSLAAVTRLVGALRPRAVLAVVSGPLDRAVAAALGAADARLRELGTRICVEFLPTRSVRSIGDVLRLTDLAGTPDVGVMIDSWHFLRGPDTWASLGALPLGRIGFVQFCDAPSPVSEDLVAEYMHRRELPGRGELDLTRFSRDLLDKGYDGVVSVEVLSDPWRDRPLTEFTRATLDASRPYWRRARAPR